MTGLEKRSKCPEFWNKEYVQKYKGNGNAMLEVYSPGNMQSPDYECGIWVPICKPEEKRVSVSVKRKE